jgi:hypothetical protein
VNRTEDGRVLRHGGKSVTWFKATVYTQAPRRLGWLDDVGVFSCEPITNADRVADKRARDRANDTFTEDDKAQRVVRKLVQRSRSRVDVSLESILSTTGSLMMLHLILSKPDSVLRIINDVKGGLGGVVATLETPNDGFNFANGLLKRGLIDADSP